MELQKAKKSKVQELASIDVILMIQTKTQSIVYLPLPTIPSLLAPFLLFATTGICPLFSKSCYSKVSRCTLIFSRALMSYKFHVVKSKNSLVFLTVFSITMLLIKLPTMVQFVDCGCCLYCREAFIYCNMSCEAQNSPLLLNFFGKGKSSL